MTKVIELAKLAGVSRRAMAYRMKRWPEARWKEPARPNAKLVRVGIPVRSY